MRLVVHAGFHKTGTSSVQQSLEANRAALAPDFRVLLKDDMKGLTEAARAYSRTLDDVEWALFRYEAHHVLGALDGEDPRPVLMSSEDLAGHMPFRHALPDYGAAPRLLAGLVAILRELHPTAEPSILLTTRDARAWVRSCWAQHVRAVQFTEDRAHYVERALPHADLDAMADRIAEAVAPVPVHRRRLEDMGGTRLGPLDVLLDLVAADPGLRAGLNPVVHANAAMPDDVLDDLLALNRSGRPWSMVKEEKKKRIRKARRAEA